MDDLHEAIKENEELHEKIRQLEQEVFGLQEERDKAQAQAAAAANAEPQAAVRATTSTPAAPDGPSKGLALIKDLTKTIKTDHLRSKIKEEEEVIEGLRQSLGQEQALTKRLQEEKASLQQRLSAASLETSQARAEADLLRKKVKESQEGMELERTALRQEIQDLREQLEEAHFSFGAGAGMQREATSLRFSAAEDTLALQLEGLGGLEGADSGSEAGDARPPSAGVSSKEVQRLQSECASLREQLNDARKAQSECKQLGERLAAAEEKARKFQSAADEAQLSNELQVERNRLECRQLKEQLRYLESAPMGVAHPQQRREASGTRGRQEAQEPQAAAAGPSEPPEWLPAEEAALRECLQLRKQLASLEGAREECSQLRSKLEEADQVRVERDQLLSQVQGSGGSGPACRAQGAALAAGDWPSAAPDRPPPSGRTSLAPAAGLAAPQGEPPEGGESAPPARRASLAPAVGLAAPQGKPPEGGALQSQATVLRETSQLRQELAAEQGRVCEQMAAAEAARRDCARLREELDAAERNASAVAWPRVPAAVAESEKEEPDELREELDRAQEAQAIAARELQSHCGQLQQQLAGIKRALSESPVGVEQAPPAAAHRPSAHRLRLGVAQEEDASPRPSRLGFGVASEVVQPSGIWERLESAQRDAARLRERLAAAQEAQQACARLQGQLAAAEAAQGGAEPELRERVAALELELERAGGRRSLDSGMDSFLGSFSCFSGRSRKSSAPPSSRRDCGDEAAHPAAPTRPSVSGQGPGARASIRRARLRDR